MPRKNKKSKLGLGRKGVNYNANTPWSYNEGFNYLTAGPTIYKYPGLILPPRYSAYFDLMYQTAYTFSGSSAFNAYLSLNDPTTNFPTAGQNVGGLSWLIGQPTTASTQSAPYTEAVVEDVDIRVSLSISDPGATLTHTCTACLFPLVFKATTASATTDELEQWGHSNLINLGNVATTVPVRAPNLTANYAIHRLLGIPKALYMGNVEEYGIKYNGLITAANTLYLALNLGTTNGATDTTLGVTAVWQVRYHITFMTRNMVRSAAPTFKNVSPSLVQEEKTSLKILEHVQDDEYLVIKKSHLTK